MTEGLPLSVQVLRIFWNSCVFPKKNAFFLCENEIENMWFSLFDAKTDKLKSSTDCHWNVFATSALWHLLSVEQRRWLHLFCWRDIVISTIGAMTLMPNLKATSIDGFSLKRLPTQHSSLVRFNREKIKILITTSSSTVHKLRDKTKCF